MNKYDIVIIGSGIAGSSIALPLSRLKCKILVVEKGTHPRFVIGESTVPSTTIGMEQIAHRYNIPEFLDVFHYQGLRRNGLVGYPKGMFWYGYHRKGEHINPKEELLLETFTLPYGPDVHMLRADADHHLVKQFPKYGVEYMEQTGVQDFKGKAGDVTLTLSNKEKGDFQVTCNLVIDASGHTSFFGNKYNLKDHDPKLFTNTRSIFGHFTGVEDLENVMERNPEFRIKRHGGTQHHMFDGGWMWIIPFDNGVTSVGLLHDRDKYPFDPKVDGLKELMDHIAQYPDMQKHLGKMKPVGKVIKTDRIQFTSSTILGDGYLLAAHASGFIDPLFSTGIVLTQGFIVRFLDIIKNCLKTGDYSKEQFKSLEDSFLYEIDTADKIVSGCIYATQDFRVFKQYWRTWTYATYLQYATRMMTRHGQKDGIDLLFGGGVPEWREVLARMHKELFSAKKVDRDLAERLKAIMDELPHPNTRFDYDIDSKRACSLAIENPAYYFKWFLKLIRGNKKIARFHSRYWVLRWIFGFFIRKWKYSIKYFFSKMFGTTFYKSIDYIRSFRYSDASIKEARRQQDSRA